MVKINELDIAITNMKMANQRTYLAYVRTGFLIAGVAGLFKKKWIAFFGIIMILGSTIQYYLIDKDLNDKSNTVYDLFDKMPIVYVLLSVGVLYLQMKDKK